MSDAKIVLPNSKQKANEYECEIDRFYSTRHKMKLFRLEMIVDIVKRKEKYSMNIDLSKSHIDCTFTYQDMNYITKNIGELLNVGVVSTLTTVTENDKKRNSISLSNLSNVSDTWQTTIYHIVNPLVIVMCIGDYDSDVLPSLVGATRDYINSIYTFHGLFGYSLVYQNKVTKKAEYLKTIHGNEKLDLAEMKQNVKIRWTIDEIEEFFENAKKTIVTRKHDGCICIISAHGHTEKVLIDSEGEEISLEYLYSTFDGENCRYLVDKPKIFFYDICRRFSITQKMQLSLPARNNDNNSNNSNNKENKVLNDKNSIHIQNITETNNSLHFVNKQVNFRYVYINPESFGAVDGGINGSFLIRALKRVFSNLEISLNKTLSEIVHKLRLEMKMLVGRGVPSVAIVEDVNSMTYHVRFKKNNNDELASYH